MKQQDNTHTFAMPDPDDKRGQSQSRQSKIFTPEFTPTAEKPPESICGSENEVNSQHYPGIGLQALPIKGLKQLVVTLGLLLLFIMAWQLVTIYQALSESHWSLSAAFLGLIAVVAVFALRCCFSFIADKENMAALADIQQQTSALKAKTDKGAAKAVLKQLAQFYADKPHASLFDNCIAQLPDYHNDRETIKQVEQVFVKPLDEAALTQVSKHSVNTSMIVAASPWASVDMLLALWRSMKMIDEVGKIYGMRPSLTNRYRMLLKVIKYLAFIGVSELAISELMQEFGTTSLAGITGVRLSQGVSAGIYTARIGVAAMHVCRPIAFEQDNKPKLKHLINGIINHVSGK